MKRSIGFALAYVAFLAVLIGVLMFATVHSTPEARNEGVPNDFIEYRNTP